MNEMRVCGVRGIILTGEKRSI